MSKKIQFPEKKIDGSLTKKYSQRSVKKRIEAFFLDNVGKVVSRDMLVEVARDPTTNERRENWHQRLSELRTDEGYTIISWRDWKELSPGEYVLISSTKNPRSGRRIIINPKTWSKVLENANNKCEWNADGAYCGLEEGEIDPVSGGTVKLTPDHKTPHSFEPNIDPDDPGKWQALCPRHQVVKKNYWDTLTGKINTVAIVQSAPDLEKRKVYEFLKKYFAES